MAKRTVVTYTVEGSLAFPFDMLRYDRVTPASEADSAVIEQSTRLHGRHSRGEQLRVTVTGERCTPERWGSFGWRLDSDTYKEERVAR